LPKLNPDVSCFFPLDGTPKSLGSLP
jgi:hypothetical protein